MISRSIVVVGGGAAGFFAAIACAEAAPGAAVTILERSAQFLGKVRISGGGRCNVTHACFDAAGLAARYPRGERALLAPYRRFQAADTVAWFAARSVKLKTERDGRMFPATDSSQTIIECLLRAAESAGVKLWTNAGVVRAARNAASGFAVTLGDGRQMNCDALLLATGGCRAASAGELAVELGHTLAPPVPSLFTFHVDSAWVRELSGVSVPTAHVSIPGLKLRETGPLLLTHWGLSGPVILKLSAWGARELHGLNYQFPVLINWLPELDSEQIAAELRSRRESQPARLVINTPMAPLPGRLWEQLALAAGIPRATRWADLSRPAQHGLVQQLVRTELPVSGKSLNKDEFVTCGGVKLAEVNFKTMESRICPGLYFAGELLDVDGLTGGFNFQAAWTTGWIAGRARAGVGD
jgi:predicted Rossmann fold flavoprotein